MAKYNCVIRLTGSRTAKVKRFKDQGIYIAVPLNDKLAEGRPLKVNIFGSYSDFYYAEVVNERNRRRVCAELRDYNDGIHVVELSDPFTLDIFPNRRSRYVRRKGWAVDALKDKKLKGVANKCFRNVGEGYLPKSGFLRFSRKAEGLK